MKTSWALPGTKPTARPPARAPEQTDAPPMATTARISRLSNISKSVPPATAWAAPKSAPAIPAMAAERVNTASLVVVSDRPRVAQAASESLAATRTRPKGPRRRARRAMEKRAKTTPKKMVNALSELTFSPKRAGRWMGTEPSKPKTADHGKKALSMRLAKGHGQQGQVQAVHAEGRQRDQRPDPAGDLRRHVESEQGAPGTELVHGVAVDPPQHVDAAESNLGLRHFQRRHSVSPQCGWAD